MTARPQKAGNRSLSAESNDNPAIHGGVAWTERADKPDNRTLMPFRPMTARGRAPCAHPVLSVRVLVPFPLGNRHRNSPKPDSIADDDSLFPTQC